jgi:hypothetical protein
MCQTSSMGIAKKRGRGSPSASGRRVQAHSRRAPVHCLRYACPDFHRIESDRRNREVDFFVRQGTARQRACDTSVVERAGSASRAENRSGGASRRNLSRDGHAELTWRQERRELRSLTSAMRHPTRVRNQCAPAGHKLPLHLVLLLTPARGSDKRSPG